MNITTYGLDVAKRAFQMYWVDAQTGEILNRRFVRVELIAFETLLLATLERESSRAGFHWIELTEADFSEQLAVK